MIYLKTQEEIELLRENNLLVSRALAEVGRAVKPGITTRELNDIAEAFIRNGAGVIITGRIQEKIDCAVYINAVKSLIFKYKRSLWYVIGNA